MENTPEIKQIIEENADLFWHIPETEKKNISNEVLIEYIFNYGTMESVIKIINILGKKNTAKIFFSIKGRRAGNFYPEIYNLFSLYLKRYV